MRSLWGQTRHKSFSASPYQPLVRPEHNVNHIIEEPSTIHAVSKPYFPA